MPVFVKNRVFNVDQLKHNCGRDGKFHDGFDFGKHDKEKMRLALMVRGDSRAKRDFEFKSIQGCREIFYKFIKNKYIVEKLIRYIEEESISGYQL